MKKSDIEIHERRYMGRGYPAVNVKVYCRTPDTDDVMEKFPECDEATAQKALEFAYESAVERFWEDVQETAEYHLGKHVEVCSAGRSSGWLVVEGLEDVEKWDAIACSKWFRFEKSVKADIKWRASKESVLEDIEANQWHKGHSERYNFLEKPDGTTVVIADLKKAAVEAGFGAVVRK